MPRRKLSGPRKLSERSNTADELIKRTDWTPDKISLSSSSSELLDFTSEESKLHVTSCDTEPRATNEGRTQDAHGDVRPDRGGRGDQAVKMSVEKDVTVSLGMATGHESLSPSEERSFASSDSRLNFRASFTLSDLQEELIHGMQEEFVREIEELRSENDYLKDELEELQAEMLEMRDEFLEEDMCQLQALRQQLDQANKNCRILQYRLCKAERRSLRVAQTGHVDGELISLLEQDLKVAKDVSIRLHRELGAVERRRVELEQENTGLRERLQELEVARQVLQVEFDKTRENSLKRKGSRSSFKSEKKLLPQEDSADLKCQLHFAKEESTLMCRKLAKLARENERMAEELSGSRSQCGRAEGLVEGQAAPGRSRARTREAEVRVHLQLVEEEAGLLSRRIVELEVENRGLRAEMEEMKNSEQVGREGQLGEAGGRSAVVKTELQDVTVAGEMGHSRLGTHPSAELETLPGRAATSVVQHKNQTLCHLDSRLESYTGAPEVHGDDGRPSHAQLALGDLCLGVGNYPALLEIRDQACLLHSAICLLTASDSTHLHSPTCQIASPASPSPHSPVEQGVMGKSCTKLDTLARELENLQFQLRAIMDGVEVLRGFRRVHVQVRDSLALPMDAQDGEGSVGYQGCHKQDQSEWQVKGQAEKGDGLVCDQVMAMSTQTRASSDIVEPPLQNQKGRWMSQPRRDVPQQDQGLQSLLAHKQSNQDRLLLLSLQLRCFLKHWRQGNGLELEQRGLDFMEVNSMDLLWEEEKQAAHQTDSSSLMALEDALPLGKHKQTLPLENHKELEGMNRTLLELKEVLQELTAEMQVERRMSRDLVHKFACAKSAWKAERAELLTQIHQGLHGEISEKDTYAGTEAKGTDLHSPDLRWPLRPSSIHRGEVAGPRGQPGPRRSWQYQERADPYRTWGGPLRTSSCAGLDVSAAAAMKRSHTAPERTGLRLYFSPPATRRGHRRSPPWLPLEANLSDDMKERTHCGRRAPESGRADAACQTAGVAVASVALQTEDPASARPPRRPLSDPLERAPGQPRCRTPKLQRRVSSPSSLPSSSILSSPSASSSMSSSASSFSSSSSSSAAPSSAPPWRATRGQNGSAWARSTTPRAADGPGAGRGAGGKPEARAGAAHKYGVVQEFLRSVCGRGRGPAVGGQGRGGSGAGGKMERAAPRVPVPAGSDSVARIVNKRFMRHSLREEPGRGARALHTREKSASNSALEDTACECTSRSVTFCFARPSGADMPHTPGQCRLHSGTCCQSSHGRTGS